MRQLLLQHKNDDFVANSASKSRPICECDRVLVTFLYNVKPKHDNYDADYCVKSYTSSDDRCCQWDKFLFASYNPDKSCCGEDGVQEAGTCFA